MARSFNGSSQYLTSASDISYTRSTPFFIAALFKRAATGSDHTLMSEYSGAAEMFQFKVHGSFNTIYFSEGGVAGAPNKNMDSTFGNTDWNLAVVGVRNSSGIVEAWHYNYNTHAYTYTLGDSSWSSGDMAATAQSHRIGAYATGATEKFNGEIAWTAIWNYDLGAGGTTNAPLIWELVRNGPWRIANAAYKCQVFVPHSQSYAAKDMGKTGVIMNDTGSPPYTVTRFTEKIPKVNPLWLAQAAGSTVQALATNSSWSFSATAGLAVTKPLATASSWAFSATSDLAITKPLATASSWAFSATADLALTKPLATASSWAFSATGALSLTKPLAAVGSWTWSATADMTTGMSATGSWSFSATAQLSITKLLASAGSWAFSGLADLTTTGLFIPSVATASNNAAASAWLTNGPAATAAQWNSPAAVATAFNQAASNATERIAA